MKKKNKSDLRIIKTKKNIRQAFIKMLCEMDYEKITVQELSKRAMIDRKTFYAHYDTLDTLLEELQHEMAKNFMERTKNMKRPRDIDKVTREFFLYSEELGELGEKLNCSESRLSQEIKSEIMSEMWKTSIPDNIFLQNILVSFVSQSTLAIYRQWTADKKKIPLEEIIKIATDLICNGVNGLYR